MFIRFIFYDKYFLRSKEAIWNFIPELNLVCFVLIFDFSNTFFGNFFKIQIICQCQIFDYLNMKKISKKVFLKLNIK